MSRKLGIYIVPIICTHATNAEERRNSSRRENDKYRGKDKADLLQTSEGRTIQIEFCLQEHPGRDSILDM